MSSNCKRASHTATNTDPQVKTIQAATMAPILVTHTIHYIQWNLSNADTIGTTTASPEYRGVHILEDSGVFPVGVAMCTHAVERYKGVFQSPPLYTMRKGNQRLLLCISVPLCPVVESFSPIFRTGSDISNGPELGLGTRLRWWTTLYERHASVCIIN